ncbi:MAG: MgtC/SapB family protein [Parvularcula sp.]|jgi:putative Mg2+ transporter-C (MgtC) family protein|nr:MgtC/SapB family protein [Parvularcula sp.]
MDSVGFESTLGAAEIALRFIVASLAGGIIGFDRERRDKAAGLRTCMLVSLAAAVFTVLTYEISMRWTTEERVVADPVRIVDAVTGGVAFIAAGAIIAKGGTVKGLTTGAAVLLAGALGLGAGAGFYIVVLLAVLTGAAVLIGLRGVERRFFHHDD